MDGGITLALGDIIVEYKPTRVISGRAIAISLDRTIHYLTDFIEFFPVIGVYTNTGTFQREIPISVHYGALFYDKSEDVFWGGREEGDFIIDKLDPVTFNIISSIDYSALVDPSDTPFPGRCLGITVDPCSNTIFFAQDSGIFVYNITKQGEFIKKFNTPLINGINGRMSGITTDGFNLWMAIYSDENRTPPASIVQTDTNGEEITCFSTGDNYIPIDMEVDTKTFADQNKCVIWTNDADGLPFGNAVRVRAWEIPCPNVNVTPGTSDAQNEPSIAVSPLDPNIIVAASNSEPSLGVYRSVDGGRSFDRRQLELPPAFGVSADPIVVASYGNLFFIGGLASTNLETRNGTIIIYRSENNGIDFSGPITVQLGSETGGNNDKPFFQIDNSPSLVMGRLYVSYVQFTENDQNTQILFQFSDNLGNSWSPSFPLTDVTAPPSGVDGPNVAVGAHGEVYVGWLEFLSFPTQRIAIFRVRRSTDFGVSFSDPVTVSMFTTVTELPPPVPEWSFRIPTFAFLATDTTPTSPFLGNVYAVWQENREGSAHIFLSISQDRGETWSSAIQVDDSPAGSQNFFPSIAVSPVNGRVDVIYYTNRLSSTMLDVFIAQSINGGESFLPSCRLTTDSIDPNVGERPDFIGDYISNTIDSNGNTLSVWTDTRTGSQDIFLAKSGGPNGQLSL